MIRSYLLLLVQLGFDFEDQTDYKCRTVVQPRTIPIQFGEKA